MNNDKKTKMPFGKYKGIDIIFINSGYLRWLLNEDWFISKDDDLVLAVEKELELRDMDDSHFYEDKVNIYGA